MVGKEKDVVCLERETVIPILKPKLIIRLVDLIEHEEDRADFKKFCKRVEYTVRAWNVMQFEDLMDLYSLFDPIKGNKKLEHYKFSEEKIDELELEFLKHTFQVMEKSNFKIVSDAEVEIAESAQYLLNLPIEVDESKLDDTLLPRYFAKYHDQTQCLPDFADRYIIFRRGMGVDQMTNYFFMEKVDMLVSRIGRWFLNKTRIGMILPKKTDSKRIHHPKKTDETCADAEQGAIYVERKRIENMEISFRNLFGKVAIQEPIFDRMIVIYRRASTRKKKERGIYLKQFKDIPMADMELILPEKKKPSLTPTDRLTLLVSAIIGLFALIRSLEMPKADIWVVIAILSGLIGYCAEIYFRFQRNMAIYQNLITQSMYDKQLDSGKGTLLHLCNDVIQQEVKEVIIAFFILMEKGKTTLKELDSRCEELVEEEFGEKCNFEVSDAVQKLDKLGIITCDSVGQISCISLKRANEIIGPTTEELVERVSR